MWAHHDPGLAAAARDVDLFLCPRTSPGNASTRFLQLRIVFNTLIIDGVARTVKERRWTLEEPVAQAPQVSGAETDTMLKNLYRTDDAIVAWRKVIICLPSPGTAAGPTP